jgi:hypothetical protein
MGVHKICVYFSYYQIWNTFGETKKKREKSNMDSVS